MQSIHLFVVVAAGAALAGSACGGVIFSDNFDTEHGGLAVDGIPPSPANGTFNYTSFANWNVTAGSVDLIGVGGSYDFFGGTHGLYVDMDGTTGSAGTIETYTSFMYTAGVHYLLEFQMAGNHRGASDEPTTAMVGIGGASYEVHFTDANTPFTQFQISFVGDGTSSPISFAEMGGSDQGQLLDNVVLSSVPLPPAAWAGVSTLAGVMGLGFIRRRRMGDR